MPSSSSRGTPDRSTIAFASSGATSARTARLSASARTRHVGEAGRLDHPEVVVAPRGAGHAADPGEHVLRHRLGQRALEDDVRHDHPPAGTKDARHLAEDGGLVGHEVDHAVARHRVHGSVLHRQRLQPAFAEVDAASRRPGRRSRGRERASRASCPRRSRGRPAPPGSRPAGRRGPAPSRGRAPSPRAAARGAPPGRRTRGRGRPPAGPRRGRRPRSRSAGTSRRARSTTARSTTTPSPRSPRSACGPGPRLPRPASPASSPCSSPRRRAADRSRMSSRTRRRPPPPTPPLRRPRRPS